MQSASLEDGMNDAWPHIDSAADGIEAVIAIVGKSLAWSPKYLAGSR